LNRLETGKNILALTLIGAAGWEGSRKMEVIFVMMGNKNLLFGLLGLDIGILHQ
jgi:hypothetical protein